MGFFSPAEVLDILGDKAQIKKKLSILRLFLLSILGGSFIAEGFLAAYVFREQCLPVGELWLLTWRLPFPYCS